MSGPSPRHLGRYELLTRLATGGMAEVYLARERGVRGLERLVVVKRILPHLAVQPSFVDMFVREARIIARLSHPNVVQIYELAEEDGEFYIVMEYVAGGTLRELLEATDHPIPVGVAVSLVSQACRGAHAAHELKDTSGRPLGLVHRDISPHNLMVTRDGCVKLLDFGIAKSTRHGSLESTDSGTLKGKHSYMSPEQCHHQPLDRRSDVFSLGIVAWELLAGRRLYRRETELATLQAIVDEDAPDIRTVRPDVSPTVAAVLRRALQRNRNLRFPTADELRRTLLEASAGLDASDDTVARLVVSTLRTRYEDRQAELEALARVETDQVVHHAPTRHIDLLAEGLTPDPLHATQTTNPSRRKIRAEKRQRFILGTVAALGGAVVAALVLTLLFPVHPPLRLSGPPLLVGLAPTMDAGILADEFEPLRLYLENQTGRPIIMRVGSSYEELSLALLRGQLDIASLPPVLYLRAREQDARVEALAFKLYEGSQGTDGVFLVPDASGVSGLKDLKGKRFCYTDRNSTTGYLLPRAALRAAGLDPDKVPAEVKFTGTHLQLLRELNEGHCDVGATYSDAYRSAERAGIPVARLRVLHVTGRCPQDALVAGPAASAEDRTRMKEALLHFDPMMHLGLPAVGRVQRITGFAPADDAAYNGLRAMLAAEP